MQLLHTHRLTIALGRQAAGGVGRRMQGGSGGAHPATSRSPSAPKRWFSRPVRDSVGTGPPGLLCGIVRWRHASVLPLRRGSAAAGRAATRGAAHALWAAAHAAVTCQTLLLASGGSERAAGGEHGRGAAFEGAGAAAALVGCGQTLGSVCWRGKAAAGSCVCCRAAQRTCMNAQVEPARSIGCAAGHGTLQGS